MGSRFHLVVVGHDSPDSELDRLADQLVARLAQLEARWTRFRPSSEISQLNDRPQDWHQVSPDTVRLIAAARRAWHLTDGAYDPTVLAALRAHGYRRPLDPTAGVPPSTTVEPVSAAPGCAGIQVDVDCRLVKLGPGVGFDPGGIGKGLAADLLAARGLELGATGVLVGLGGDIVCRGSPPDGHSWPIDVFEPSVTDQPVTHLHLSEGAVVTSTTNKRRWATDCGPRHHVIDPRTGLNTTGPVLVSVVAATGWWAEAVATQLMVDGPQVPVDPDRVAALVIDQAGIRHDLGPIEEYRR